MKVKDAADQFLSHRRIAVTGVSRHAEAVVIGTRPSHAEGTVHDCADLGIKQIWMHRAFGEGSVSPDADAAAWGRDHGMTVIEGGCPLMFGGTSDTGHRVMCRLLTLTGKVPRTV